MTSSFIAFLDAQEFSTPLLYRIFTLQLFFFLGAIHKRRQNILGGKGGLKFRCCMILEGRSQKISVEIPTWERGVSKTAYKKFRRLLWTARCVKKGFRCFCSLNICWIFSCHQEGVEESFKVLKILVQHTHLLVITNYLKYVQTGRQIQLKFLLESCKCKPTYCRQFN